MIAEIDDISLHPGTPTAAAGNYQSPVRQCRRLYPLRPGERHHQLRVVVFYVDFQLQHKRERGRDMPHSRQHPGFRNVGV
jgi:hypothetical protein